MDTQSKWNATKDTNMPIVQFINYIMKGNTWTEIYF